MLPTAHRLRDPAAFRRAVRTGRRAGRRTLVVHLLLPPDVAGLAAPALAQVGLVVSRAVGNAVVRNRVKRRLRHLARQRLAELPDGAVLVVRALPPAAEASSAQLDRDLDQCLRRARPEVRGEV